MEKRKSLLPPRDHTCQHFTVRFVLLSCVYVCVCRECLYFNVSRITLYCCLHPIFRVFYHEIYHMTSNNNKIPHCIKIPRFTYCPTNGFGWFCCNECQQSDHFSEGERRRGGPGSEACLVGCVCQGLAYPCRRVDGLEHLSLHLVYFGHQHRNHCQFGEG